MAVLRIKTKKSIKTPTVLLLPSGHGFADIHTGCRRRPNSLICRYSEDSAASERKAHPNILSGTEFSHMNCTLWEYLIFSRCCLVFEESPAVHFTVGFNILIQLFGITLRDIILIGKQVKHSLREFQRGNKSLF